ncbi:MAG TPA: hypothetical protein VN325_10200 [Steroidobacteraceae bacterium]|nr:hypothetical protein [Steroidobacteraceae bacterium]
MSKVVQAVEGKLVALNTVEHAKAVAALQSLHRPSTLMFLLAVLAFPAVDFGLRGFHTEVWWSKSLISACCSLSVITFLMSWHMQRQLAAVTTLLLQAGEGGSTS